MNEKKVTLVVEFETKKMKELFDQLMAQHGLSNLNELIHVWMVMEIANEENGTDHNIYTFLNQRSEDSTEVQL